MNTQAIAQSSVRFNHATLANSPFIQGRRTFLKFRDLGLGAATGDLMRANLMSADNFETKPTGWHYHTCDAQLVYMLEGWADMEFDGGKTPVHFLPGDCSFVPGGVPHDEVRTAPRIIALELSLPSEMGTVVCERDAPNKPSNPKLFRVFSPAGTASVRDESETALTCSDFGLAEASNGLLGGRLVEGRGKAPVPKWRYHTGKLRFSYVLNGWSELEFDSRSARIEPGDAIILPGGMPYAEIGRSSDFRMLEFSLPAAAPLVWCETPAGRQSS